MFIIKKNHSRISSHVSTFMYVWGIREHYKNCIYEQITSSSSYIYLYQRDWQEFMTYRYKTRIRLTLNTGDRAGHKNDKAHAQQQQQQRRVTQTLRRTTQTSTTSGTNEYYEWTNEYYEWVNEYYEWEKSATTDQTSNTIT